MKTESVPQSVYFSFYPRQCDGCKEYIDCVERLWQGLEGYAPSFAVAARTCNAYLKALREYDPDVPRYVLNVEARDLGALPWD